MISAILSRLVILLFGTLYPAYASYKAVRTKNVKEYVKWMMYWIVFALFTCAETFTDLFLSFWFPFYYEIKIVLVIWLLSPATKGSSILYRNFVHPALIKREQEIDEYISKAKEQGYHTMLHLGSKGVTYATNVIMQTAIKGGGGIVNHLRRSYSLSDLSDDSDLKADMNRNSKLQGDAVDTADVPRDPRMRALRKPGGSHVDLYFPEMDVDVRSHSHDLPVSLSQIRSSEDISSGYSSAEPLFVEGQVVPEGNPLMRTASVGATRARARGGRTIAQPKKILTTEEEEDAFSADYGWPHALPPYQIASLLPELLSLDPSGTLPSQPFLNPEALKLIYANSVLRNQVLLNISEIKEEEKAIVNDSKSVKRDEIFEDTADLGDLPKDKPNYTPESHESISINNGKPVESNVSSFESTTNEKVTFESTEIQAAVKAIGSEIQSTAVLLNDIDKFEAAEEEFAVKVIDPEIPSNITSNETVAIEATGEKTDAKEIDSEIPSTKDMSVASEDAIKSTPEEEVEQTNDCFEDASDAEISAIVDGRDLNSSIENKSEFSQINSLKPTGSSESLSSSEDHCFEDSLPDVAIVTRSDSFNVGDRKGKYNKSRAPLPPEVNKVDEGKVNFGDSLIPPNSNILVEPDLLLGSTTPPCEVINSEITNSKNPSNSKEENHLQEAERQSLSSLYGKRDVSPSPSSQSKKGHSNFTRFLPKTGVTSLFNFWGPKEDPTGSNKSRGKSVAKSSWSPSSEMFHSQRSSSPNFPNIDYSPEGSDVGSSNSEINSGKTTPKIKIRQMSHSPSRRRHYN